MAQHETTGDAARLAHILAGLRAFQAAARPPAPPDVPVVASAGRARLLDFGGKGPAAVFVPSLINSSRILDLAEDNSMLRWLSGEGILGEAKPVDEELIYTYHPRGFALFRSEEHTSELQSLMRISYAVFCLKKKTQTTYNNS